MSKRREEILAKLKIVAKPDDNWLSEAKFRVENQEWLKHSQKIAFKILRTLRAKGKTQKDLVESLNVSPQQVSKWVKGKENFTIETIAKIEEALGVKIFEVSKAKANIYLKTKTKMKNNLEDLSKEQMMSFAKHCMMDLLTTYPNGKDSMGEISSYDLRRIDKVIQKFKPKKDE